MLINSIALLDMVLILLIQINISHNFNDTKFRIKIRIDFSENHRAFLSKLLRRLIIFTMRL